MHPKVTLCGSTQSRGADNNNSNKKSFYFKDKTKNSWGGLVSQNVSWKNLSKTLVVKLPGKLWRNPSVRCHTLLIVSLNHHHRLDLSHQVKWKKMMVSSFQIFLLNLLQIIYILCWAKLIYHKVLPLIVRYLV